MIANIVALLVVVVGIALLAALGPTLIFRKPTVANAVYGVVWLYAWAALTLFAFFQLGIYRVFLSVITGQH